MAADLPDFIDDEVLLAGIGPSSSFDADEDTAGSDAVEPELSLVSNDGPEPDSSADDAAPEPAAVNEPADGPEPADSPEPSDDPGPAAESADADEPAAVDISEPATEDVADDDLAPVIALDSAEAAELESGDEDASFGGTFLSEVRAAAEDDEDDE